MRRGLFGGVWQGGKREKRKEKRGKGRRGFFISPMPFFAFQYRRFLDGFAFPKPAKSGILEA